MNFNKKAIESYLFLIFLVSLFMTFLIFFILSSVYVEDDIGCQNVDFQIIKKCKDSDKLKIKIKNTGQNVFSLKFDSTLIKTGDDIKINSIVDIIYLPKENIVEIIPYFQEPLSNKINFCNGKKEKINLINLLNC